MERLARAHDGRRLVEEADDGLRLTYQQASKRVNRWAGRIAQKVEPGERVVIAGANGYEFFLLCLAASRAGAIPVPVNDQMRPDEVDHVVKDSGARLVLRNASQVDGGEPLTTAHPADPGDVAALFYTSGTTGAPKGVELSHRALLGQVAGAAAWPAGLRRDEAVLALPIAHIMGFVGVIGLACAGIPVYFLPKFRPDRVLDAIESRRATFFVGVPTMYRMLLEAGAEKRDLRSIRLWVSGADAMPPDLAERFKKLGATITLPCVGSDGRGGVRRGLRDGGDRRRRRGQALAAGDRLRARRLDRVPDAGLGSASSTRTVDERRRRRRAVGPGPGRHHGLLGRRRGDCRRAHRRRLAPHRRPRPPGPVRHGDVRRPQEGRDQARRLLGVRARSRAGARGAPGRAEAAVLGQARRPQGRGARRRVRLRARAPTSPTPSSTSGRPTGSPTTRSRTVRRRRRAPQDRHQQDPEARAPPPLHVAQRATIHRCRRRWRQSSSATSSIRRRWRPAWGTTRTTRFGSPSSARCAEPSPTTAAPKSSRWVTG